MAGGFFPEGFTPDGFYPEGFFPEVDTGTTPPHQFFFETRFKAATATPYVSSTAVIAGLGAPSTSTVANGEQSVNGAAFTTDPAAIDNGDELRLRATSSAAAGTLSAATATIEGVVGTFAIVTAAAEQIRTSWHRRAVIAFRRRVA